MIVVPRGVCKNILSGRRGGSAVNIFVVLLGNVQWSFLMGTTACQGEKLPLAPHLLCWDTGSHPKDGPGHPSFGEKLGRPTLRFAEGLQGQVLLVPPGDRYFSSGDIPSVQSASPAAWFSDWASADLGHGLGQRVGEQRAWPGSGRAEQPELPPAAHSRRRARVGSAGDTRRAPWGTRQPLPRCQPRCQQAQRNPGSQLTGKLANTPEQE